jgi:amino-acid N-acetyltransferase
MQVVIRSATRGDQIEIQSRLKEAGLPYQDILPHLDHFLLAESSDGVVGCIGLEIYTDAALLRSLVVRVGDRKKKIGRRLCEEVFDYARRLQVKRIYLLTETAADFFRKLGFEQIERNLAPVTVQSTAEFKSLCPSSATCMVLLLPS